VCLHGDVSFLPSSLLPSLVWSEFSTSCISQRDLNSPFLMKYIATPWSHVASRHYSFIQFQLCSTTFYKDLALLCGP
jgi:hypothetical protein